MSVFLFRHGEAFQLGEKQGIHSDFDRPLTPKGVEITREVCRGLRALGISCDRIWHSPLVRAVETARIISEEMETPVLEPKEGLAGGEQEEALYQSLRNHDPLLSLFLVGHQPYLGEWTERLVTGESAGGISISKSGVACLEMLPHTSSPRAELRWLLRAKHLRIIGKNR